MTAGLDALERADDATGAALDLGQIAVACALGWLEFRRPLDAVSTGPIDLAHRYPKLMARYARLLERPSFAATAPS